MPKKKAIDPVPEEFASYEQAGEFWDGHDTTHYPDAFRSVKVTGKLRHRYYEIPIAPDVVEALRARARRRHVSMGRLTNELLRRDLNTSR